MFSAAEKVGWALAVLVIAAMGAIVAHGPFNLVNTSAAAHYSPVVVKWLTDPKIIAVSVPDPVRVHVGQSVTWVNDSNAPHTATARNKSFDSGFVDIHKSWTFVPTKPGTYQYKCLYHPLMHGVLIVTG